MQNSEQSDSFCSPLLMESQWLPWLTVKVSISVLKHLIKRLVIFKPKSLVYFISYTEQNNNMNLNNYIQVRFVIDLLIALSFQTHFEVALLCEWPITHSVLIILHQHFLLLGHGVSVLHAALFQMHKFTLIYVLQSITCTFTFRAERERVGSEMSVLSCPWIEWTCWATDCHFSNWISYCIYPLMQYSHQWVFSFTIQVFIIFFLWLSGQYSNVNRVTEWTACTARYLKYYLFILLFYYPM